MFEPDVADVRNFFAVARQKRTGGGVLTPLETIAADWTDAHPEYAADLAAVATPGDGGAGGKHVASNAAAGGDGRENPFLHLSMHLAISEQLQVDQPRGIRAAFEKLQARLGSAHAAQHEVMECLGRMLWDSQRGGKPPDGEAYVECVRRRATR